MRLRCVYAGGRPLPGVYVMPLRGEAAFAAVIIGHEYHIFAFREELKEFLKQRLGVEDFEIRPCPD
jgi:hypothetical protein